MPKAPNGTIVLDQEEPIHVGDTITFTVTGDRAKYINIGVYDLGLMWAKTLIPVGTPIKIEAAGEAYAWLDNDKDMAFSMAATRFTVVE